VQLHAQHKHEEIQCQALLRLTGLTKCHLFQQFGEKTKVNVIEFDSHWWKEIESALVRFVEHLDALVESEELQEKLFKGDEFTPPAL
jgi:hypothetical protein